MSLYAVGLIGTSAPESPGMAPNHARAYLEIDNCELIACADIVAENAEWFAAKFEIEDANVFTDYHKMLTELDLDMVSVCTPIDTHADIVIDCAHCGDLRAIHCEKPMADTWKGSQLMAQECSRQDVQLTFNHQLRFCEPVQQASELLAEGAIGDLERVEMSRANLYEAGTHQVDLCSHFTSDIPAEWVLGQLDYRDLKVVNGAHVEDQTVACWEYDNGVHGFAATGSGADIIGCRNRLVGTEGVLEIDQSEVPLRIRREGSASIEAVDCEFNWRRTLRRAIGHAVDAIDSDEEPLLSARNAMIATEIIFAVWESSRQRGRIDLPLTVNDNALTSMVDAGDLTPE